MNNEESYIDGLKIGGLYRLWWGRQHLDDYNTLIFLGLLSEDAKEPGFSVKWYKFLDVNTTKLRYYESYVVECLEPIKE